MFGGVRRIIVESRVGHLLRPLAFVVLRLEGSCSGLIGCLKQVLAKLLLLCPSLSATARNDLLMSSSFLRRSFLQCNVPVYNVLTILIMLPLLVDRSSVILWKMRLVRG